MEDRLQRLLEATSEAHRVDWALEAKKQGKKVIGILCPYVPEEVIYAAGMLPYHIIGTWRENLPRADVYWPGFTDRYSAHALESLLAGELDFLDGVVGTDSSDAARRCLDNWIHIGKTPLARMMHLPHRDSEESYQAFAREIANLIEALETSFGVRVTEESLRGSIELYNKVRASVMKLYELRKRDRPPFSGAEFLRITTAALVMGREEYLRELEGLSEYIEERQAPIGHLSPRLLVASDRLFHPGYLDLIEDVGALVAMDDLDTGSRYFWDLVDTSGDPLYALARRYITRPACPRMSFWDRQVDQVVRWVKEYRIDGVINYPQIYSYPRHYQDPYFRRRLTEAGIPVTTIFRDYHLANEGQLRTRVGAFVETLGVGPKPAPANREEGKAQ